jgi:dTDP-4-dehydrorhamnose reductase/dTDP-4-dehydrorhamnose 3,5-epimerase
MDETNSLVISKTNIPGLLVLDLPVHGDSRGWFKENWQREKMVSLGLPNFQVVQNNVSFNAAVGTTRGIHAEPWEKFISVTNGSFFGAWVDLREGPTFGEVFTSSIDVNKAVFVPRGVGNSFQTLEENTTYSYLVSEHWSKESQSKYTFVNLADPTLNIDWPTPLSKATLSAADLNHPMLSEIVAIKPKKILILGAGGQLGKALALEFPDADCYARDDLDITSSTLAHEIDWSDYATVLNAAAYTNVDGAESATGRREAWNVNVHGVVNLATIALKHDLELVHFSSDYVFDGEEASHTEDERFSPLGVYGQTKAAGDAVVSLIPKHYIIRTSWVIGEGKNFIETMRELARKGVSPNVVNDQVGSITRTDDLARATRTVLMNNFEYGTYNVTSGGPAESWLDIARRVFESEGRSGSDVLGISTKEYVETKPDSASRPLSSALDSSKFQRSVINVLPFKSQDEA